MSEREHLERLRSEADAADKREGTTLKGASGEVRRAMLAGATRQ